MARTRTRSAPRRPRTARPRSSKAQPRGAEAPSRRRPAGGATGTEWERLARTAARLRAARARAERALRASEARCQELAEALAESARLRADYLGILSHELRNPLAAVRNSLLVQELAPPDGEQARRARLVQLRQLEHLERLVDELLDATRAARGKITLQQVPLELRELVERTADDHRALLQRCGVALEVELPEAAVWVHADRTRLRQVLGNLLQNASKFTPAGGRAVVSLAVEGKEAALRVRDDGIGLEPGLQGRLFEPFVQGAAGLARARGGVGLGLALVKDLIELHGGTVQATSPGPGRGTEVCVHLPVVPAPPPALAPPGPRLCAAIRTRSILVIEDLDDAARVLADLLSLRGHRVEVASSGRAGIEAARAHRPEFVLCDIGLPDVDGYEVARTLRADPALRGTRLVALSGYTQAEDRERAARAGFDLHLPKPTPLDRLSELLAQGT